ncbi:hypothetical protein ANCCAN_13056 [Ancylostoma caninum]|uniref:Uncharacterized protein n=1 Tax=Ancylostoma caninum TaxID=29170 RepID=A0A368G9C9_ANCCA|nr:hypothetical protein ANCCAN_13056 [Ancylostoma caninum]
MSEVIENIKTKTIKNDKKQGNKAKDDSVKTAKLKVQNPNVSRISTLTAQGKRTPIKNRTVKKDDTKTCIAPPPAQQDPQRPTPIANGTDQDDAKFDLWLNLETATPGPLKSVTSTATKVSRTAAKETSAPPLPTSAARTDQSTTQQGNPSKESIGNVGGTANQTTSLSTSLETAKDISTIDPKEAAKYCFLNQPKEQKLVENPEKFGEDSTMTAVYQDFDLYEIKDNNKPADIRRLEEFFAFTKEKEQTTQQPSVTNDVVPPARRPVEQSQEMRKTGSRQSKDHSKNRKKQKKILRLHPSRSLTKIATLFKDKSKKKLKAKTQPTMQRS